MTSEARVFDAGAGLSDDVTPHRCFACGTLNEQGLGLVLHVEAQRAWAELELDPRFQGWDDVAHGGIICTILDEVMAWALAAGDDWGVTARMSVTFRRPVKIGAPIRAEGWITRNRRRIIETEAHIIDRDGAVLAAATGIYVAADEQRKEQLRARYGVRRDEGPR
ncbi:MAG: PaaI family thioesterase [Candidatus Limnocylindrales bacterium]